MKKFIFGFFGLILWLVGGIGFLIMVLAIVAGERTSFEIAITASLLVAFLIGTKMFNLSCKLCWCGGTGHFVDAEYVGSDFRHSSTERGFIKREVKKYKVTYECDRCGKHWTKSGRKTGDVERHYFD